MKKFLFVFILFYPFLYLFSVEKKIISLTPAITSILIDLGYSDNIIGITSNDFYLKREVVGSIINIYNEKVIQYRPDIVIYQDFQEFMVRDLKSILKNTLFLRLDIKDVDSIFRESKKIIDILDSKTNLDRWYNYYLDEVKKCKNSINKNFTYIFIVDRDNYFSNVFVAGNKSFLTGIVNAIGGMNLINYERDYIKVNPEVFLTYKDIIIIDSSFNKFYNTSLIEFKRYIIIEDKRITIPDLRLGEKVKYICGLLKR